MEPEFIRRPHPGRWLALVWPGFDPNMVPEYVVQFGRSSRFWLPGPRNLTLLQRLWSAMKKKRTVDTAIDRTSHMPDGTNILIHQGVVITKGEMRLL